MRRWEVCVDFSGRVRAEVEAEDAQKARERFEDNWAPEDYLDRWSEIAVSSEELVAAEVTVDESVGCIVRPTEED